MRLVSLKMDNFNDSSTYSDASYDESKDETYNAASHDDSSEYENDSESQQDDNCSIIIESSDDDDAASLQDDAVGHGDDYLDELTTVGTANQPNKTYRDISKDSPEYKNLKKICINEILRACEKSNLPLTTILKKIKTTNMTEMALANAILLSGIVLDEVINDIGDRTEEDSLQYLKHQSQYRRARSIKRSSRRLTPITASSLAFARRLRRMALSAMYTPMAATISAITSRTSVIAKV